MPKTTPSPDEHDESGYTPSDSCLVDNVAVGGVTYAQGTPIDDLPDDVKAVVAGNPHLVTS